MGVRKICHGQNTGLIYFFCYLETSSGNKPLIQISLGVCEFSLWIEFNIRLWYVKLLLLPNYITNKCFRARYLKQNNITTTSLSVALRLPSQTQNIYASLKFICVGCKIYRCIYRIIFDCRNMRKFCKRVRYCLNEESILRLWKEV